MHRGTEPSRARGLETWVGSLPTADWCRGGATRVFHAIEGLSAPEDKAAATARVTERSEGASFALVVRSSLRWFGMLALAVCARGQSAVPFERSEHPLATGFFVEARRLELGLRPGGLSAAEYQHCERQRVERARMALVFHPVGTSTDASAWIEFTPWETAPFRDVVASWNARVPEGTGMSFELRVAKVGAAWGPWLSVGDWGCAVPGERLFVCDGGRIEVDCFVGAESFTRVQLRVRAVRATADTPGRIELERVSLCVSDRFVTHDANWGSWGRAHPIGESGELADCGMGSPIDPPVRGLPRGPFGKEWPARLELAVPFRSQKAEDPSIASRICSPTSLAMVLAYRGVDVPTAEVARVCYDAEHGIYGNWTRAIQGAFALGVPGYLTRFNDWKRVEAWIHAGQPLVISIAAQEGQLTGAPYTSTNGHLLVLRGFDEHDDVLVNDPAAPDAEHGQLTYERSELETCWLARGGTAYVLLPRRGAGTK